MHIRHLIALQLTFLALLFLAACGSAPGDRAGTSDDPDPNVTKNVVCHIAGGDPAKARSLSVGSDSVADHLAHGDAEGACPDEQRPPLEDDAVIDDDGKRTTVCHAPGGNAAKATTLTVGGSALTAHLRHGDSLGSCVADT